MATVKAKPYDYEFSPDKTALVEQGLQTAAQYRPEVVLPQWHAFLQQVCDQGRLPG